mgnify:CR=1 FL=1
MIGTQVGPYRVIARIGEGGMGAVYEAVDEQIGKRVAIKVLHKEHAKNQQISNRFINEARAINVVEHPGIVTVSSFGQLPDGTAYIVMELLKGETLNARMKAQGGRMQMLDALRLARQIASALAAAHEKGIIHRDLKPDNIMLIPHPEWPGRERVKILDLGIAKLHERFVADAGGEGERPRTVTGVGIVMGTPQYMAPEQCAGVGDPDGQVDVYALGVILYEGLTGQRPFGGQAALEIMHQHMFAAPVSLRVHRPELPSALAAMVERLLAKPAGERPTMRELAVAVERTDLGASILGAAGRAGPLLPPASELPGAEVALRPPPNAVPTDPTEPRLPPSQERRVPAPRLPFVAGPPITELRYFVGLSNQEIADSLGVSTKTVERDWEKARTYLFSILNPG